MYDLAQSNELLIAVEKHLELSPEQIAWCRKWLTGASERSAAELEDAARRGPHEHVNANGKRLLLTEEIQEEVGHPDSELVDIDLSTATIGRCQDLLGL